jgi:hypothetical protein
MENKIEKIKTKRGHLLGRSGGHQTTPMAPGVVRPPPQGQRTKKKKKVQGVCPWQPIILHNTDVACTRHNYNREGKLKWHI